MSDAYLVGRGFAVAREARALHDNLDEVMVYLRRERQQNANLRAQVAALNTEKANLQQEVLNLKVELVKKTAHGEGLTAQLNGFKAAHPMSPQLADSVRRYKDGNVKTVGRLTYEAAHDRIFAENRISDPERFRAD